jgi:ribonuclease HI
MSLESMVFIGFSDGASHHTGNISSATWVIYSPMGQLVTSGGPCLGPMTNNVAEYSIVIKLLRDVISHGIQSLEVHLWIPN